MNNDMITEYGTYWDSDDDTIIVFHTNEERPLWLTKQDLETMLNYLQVHQSYSMELNK